jgi:hypothetical protein
VSAFLKLCELDGQAQHAAASLNLLIENRLSGAKIFSVQISKK